MPSPTPTGALAAPPIAAASRSVLWLEVGVAAVVAVDFCATSAGYALSMSAQLSRVQARVSLIASVAVVAPTIVKCVRVPAFECSGNSPRSAALTSRNAADTAAAAAAAVDVTSRVGTVTVLFTLTKGHGTAVVAVWPLGIFLICDVRSYFTQEAR